MKVCDLCDHNLDQHHPAGGASGGMFFPCRVCKCQHFIRWVGGWYDDRFIITREDHAEGAIQQMAMPGHVARRLASKMSVFPR